MFYIDPLYIILSLPALIIGLVAQILIRHFYSKYSNIGNSKGFNGIETVEKIARGEDLNIKLNISFGDMSDHYNPFNKQLTLSEKVARLPSLAAVGIAAHEMGHVLQHKQSMILVSFRNLIVPVVNIGSIMGYVLFILGLSLQIAGFVFVGIALFSLSTLVAMVTLPIEIDASAKAIRMLRKYNIVASYEVDGVKKVLVSAALTYIAATVQSISTLLYYILRAFGGKRKR